MAGKIFINYRRDDSIGMAGRLHDRLAQTFGPENIFMDVDNIPVGEDFVAYLNSQVAACNVVLAVIGRTWLKARDKKGQRRLDQPDDWVAIELAAALMRKIRVIPILVDGARMPRESELPEPLRALARRQAAEVRHAHFGKDAETLVARMREAISADLASERVEAETKWKMEEEQRQANVRREALEALEERLEAKRRAEEEQKQAEAKARQQAEEEARLLEAEAKRRAEEERKQAEAVAARQEAEEKARRLEAEAKR